MTIMNEVNPPLEDVLAHHGVKGMRWGVRKQTFTKADIKTARQNVRGEQKALRVQRKAVKVASKSGNAANLNRQVTKLQDMSVKHLANPDRATALRLTRGEKAVLAVLSVPAPFLGAASAISTVGQRHQVERQLGTR